MFELGMAATWKPPAMWRRLLTIDSHTAGEPFRIVIEGTPLIPGRTMVEKRAFAERELDSLRRLLMLEPRGHNDMYGCFVTEPVSPGADFGVLFMHNEGFSTMCGHGIIAMSTVAVETGMVRATEPATSIAIDSPAGLIRARAFVDQGRVTSVEFVNVASFVDSLDQVVEVPALGSVRYDLASGGAYYAYVDATPLGLDLEPKAAGSLIRAGRAIKRAVMKARPIHHPTTPELGFLYGTIFVGPPKNDGAHSRHVCIFADGELDRSPTGTGVSARLAILAARGELAGGRRIRIESIVGTEFGGEIVEQLDFHGRPAVLPKVDGRAHLTGRSEFWRDPGDAASVRLDLT
jgi:proline racemase